MQGLLVKWLCSHLVCNRFLVFIREHFPFGDFCFFGIIIISYVVSVEFFFYVVFVA